MEHCQTCGVRVEADWAFCRSCGNELSLGPRTELAEGSSAESMPTVTDPTLPDLASGRLTRRPMLVWMAALLALVLLAVTAGIAVGLNQQLKEMRTDLDSTTSELDSTREELESTNGELTSTQAGLEDMTGDRDHLTKRVESLKTTLKGLQTSLNDVQTQVSLQAGQIDVLKTCLDGVSNALSYAAYGQYSAAINSLNAVNSECETAYALF